MGRHNTRDDNFVFLRVCGYKGTDNEMSMATKQPEPSETDDKTVASNEKEDVAEEIIDLNKDFNGINGCAVIYNPLENRCYLYEEKDYD